MLTHRAVKRAIIKSLSRDLLSPEWRKRVGPGDPPESGHCAVATEAFYHLSGAKKAGFKPVVCSYYEAPDEKIYFSDQKRPAGSLKSTHWWVRGPKGRERGLGRIFDVTVRQYKGVPFPYEQGRGTGFMQPQRKPSFRAQVIMDRVEALLGHKTLIEYKKENIRRFRLGL